jgi:hypothetical protein
MVRRYRRSGFVRYRTFGRSLRIGLGWSDLAAESFCVGLPTDAIRLRVLDRGRVALDPDSQGYTEVQRLFVCEPELSRELVDPDLLRHSVFWSLSVSVSSRLIPLLF